MKDFEKMNENRQGERQGFPGHNGGPGFPPPEGHGFPGCHGEPGFPPPEGRNFPRHHGGPGFPPPEGHGFPGHHGGTDFPRLPGGAGRPHGRQGAHFDPEKWEDEDELGSLIRMCGHRLIHQDGAGKRQEQVLKLLYEYETLSQRELLDIMKIQPGSLSELLAKLEAKSLISRQRKPEDRRILMLTLTDEGLALAESLSEKTASMLYSGLTDEEQQMLKTLLKKLLDSWKGADEKEPGVPKGTEIL